MSVLRKLPSPHSNQSGFTLLEMTIVVAIIGLLLGSVVAGQAYLRNAELVTSINEGKTLINAYNQFMQKYQEPPGDLSTAQNYWGSGDCTIVGRPYGSGPFSYVCNGNGDGFISNVTAASNEYLYAYEHLSRAGLISGQYTGTAGTLGSKDTVPGSNVMPASFKPGVFIIATFGNAYRYLNSGLYFYGFYGPVVLLAGDGQSGTVTPGIDSSNSNQIVTSREGQKLDLKFDDGKPGLGWLRSNFGSGCTDAATGASPQTASYKPVSVSDGCFFVLVANP